MKFPGRYYVYIIRCSDISYYVGVTNDIDGRFCEHADDRNPDCYTIDRRPPNLVYVEQYRNINEAIAREKTIKELVLQKERSTDYRRLYSVGISCNEYSAKMPKINR